MPSTATPEKPPQPYHLTSDMGEDVRFIGQRVASETIPTDPSVNETAPPNSTTTFTLYRSEAGAWICEETITRYTQTAGGLSREDSPVVVVCDTDAELIRTLGTDAPAKRLYQEAGVTCLKDVP